MIIRTKRVTAAGANGQSSATVETKESNKPGSTFKEKVVKTYQTKVKPEVKKVVADVKPKLKTAVTEAGNDLKDMIKK